MARLTYMAYFFVVPSYFYFWSKRLNNFQFLRLSVLWLTVSATETAFVIVHR